ncbi:hypothetical protein RSAG8_04173, partial [Rhizoctonia solani AG-8 WAC10335]
MSNANYRSSSHRDNGGYNWDNFRGQALRVADRTSLTSQCLDISYYIRRAFFLPSPYVLNILLLHAIYFPLVWPSDSLGFRRNHHTRSMHHTPLGDFLNIWVCSFLLGQRIHDLPRLSARFPFTRE